MTEHRNNVASQELQICDKQKFEPVICKTYKYRWSILGLYFLVAVSSSFQWPTYAILDNIMEKYYGITLDTVNFTATVFLLCYVVFIYPATYFLQKLGLRFAIIVGAAGPCIGALMKLFSVHPDRFWIILLAQTLIGTTQTYVSVLPATVAATWFGANQVSTACSICSAGMQIALAVGCLVPTLMFEQQLEKGDIERSLSNLNIGVAAFTSIALLLIIIFFRAEPPTPPSESRILLKNTKIDLTKSVKQIIRDVPFILFWIGYSSHLGIFYSLCFLLNPTVIRYYPDRTSDVGSIGLLLMGVGVIGAGIFGVILDKYRRFKETTGLLFTLSSVSMIALTATLTHGIIYIYIFQTMSGFFMISVVAVGLEVGAEITYPLPENISSGFLLIGSKIFGFIFTTVFSSIFSNASGFWAYFAMTAVVVFSTILTVSVPFNLKRQAVLSHSKNEHSMALND